MEAVPARSPQLRGFVALAAGEKLFWSRVGRWWLTRWFGARVVPFTGVCLTFDRTLTVPPCPIARARRGGERLLFTAVASREV